MPQENNAHEFTADDLAMIDDDAAAAPAADPAADPAATKDDAVAADPADADDGTKADDSAAAKGTDPKADDAGDPKAADPKADPKADITTDDSAKDKKDDPDAKGYWPDDWREKMAKHLAAGDEKTYEKELKRLKRFADPSGVYGMAREAENKLHTSGLVKIPGKDASEEEIAEFNKAMGVPEKPEEYFEKLQLENGAVIGEADKPIADSFAEAVHKSGATPQFVNSAMNWYFEQQEKIAAEQDEADDTFHRESKSELKEEFGPAFDRKTNAIEVLFAQAPGGTDVRNESGVYARLMGGRTADGKLIGDDPDVVRWLVGMAQEFNPAAAVTEGAGGNAQTLQAELDQLRSLRNTDRKKYDSPEVQARELELIEALEKSRAKA